MNRTKYLEDSSSAETVAYYHNGVGRPVRVKTLDVATLELDYYQDVSGTYAGFDRFGRVKDQRWVNYASTADVVRIGHGYDLAGNRIWREDARAAAASQDLDELYAYDGLHRLKDLKRGDVNTQTLAVGSQNWQENWGLDALGNWSAYRNDDLAPFDEGGFEQTREHDPANEIEEIDGSASHVGHDDAGNMTTIPKPGAWNDHYTATYDAWNRLVALRMGPFQATVLARYEYDGLNQRIVKNVYSSGNLSEVRHFYYNDRWQCLEERLEGVSGGAPTGTISANPINRYVWGLRYVDELVLRQRDTNADGTLDETLYALQDANVVALAEPDGDIVERFIYDAYGKAKVLDNQFAEKQNGSEYQWEFLYTGRRLDRESGLMYYRNRYYHTGIGRFVSRDPIGYAGGSMNLYEYVDSGPVALSDPSGLASPYDPPYPPGHSPWMPHPEPPRPLPPPDGSQGTQVRVPCSNAVNLAQNTAGAQIALQAFPAQNLEGLYCMLSDAVDSLPPGSPDCVGFLELSSNSAPDHFDLGFNRGCCSNVNQSNCTELSCILDSAIHFCQPCVIALTGCNSGTQVSTLANPSWVQQLANETGCTVIGTGGYTSTGTSFTGGNIHTNPTGNTGRPDPNWPHNAYPPQADTCYIFEPWTSDEQAAAAAQQVHRNAGPDFRPH